MDRASASENRIYGLSERDRSILRLVVQSFISTAGPVGSRFLSTQYQLGLSPASIRNTLSDLEARGFLDHPYTSAGRVPTDRGYRAYVDELMEQISLSEEEKTVLRSQLNESVTDTERLVRESSRLLGQFANLLGVAISPRLSTGILERLEVVPLSSSRAMFVISVRGGLIRTIILHIESDLSRQALDRVVQLLNERLAGLTLEEIRKSCRERVRDLQQEDTGIVQLLMDSSSMLFSEPPADRRVEVGGTEQILAQPEFQQPDELRDLIKLVDDETAVLGLLNGTDADAGSVGSARVRIGSENFSTADAESATRYSVVTAPYQRHNMRGTIGVIGPTRMDYARVISLVEGMAALLSWSPDDDAPAV
ncbi:MAG: heat-inducible transcription repressor HrcA [Rhodothermales bacterium]|nr:heat-inducible transcription repressor HrcA [Rhodothermales bacterium]MBO6780738.1 heat-inducible transcription repressor HrcA [Rhodothermales bacterium]